MMSPEVTLKDSRAIIPAFWLIGKIYLKKISKPVAFSFPLSILKGNLFLSSSGMVGQALSSSQI